MSRSYRKPYGFIVGSNKNAHKKEKQQANQTVRRQIDLVDGNYYRKIVDNWGWSTDGGKSYMPHIPKLRRK